MQPPRWDDPVGSACREAEPAIRRGLMVRPTLYGFVEGEPVVRVQPGLATLGRDPVTAQRHLAIVPPLLGLEQALVFSQARTRDETIEDEALRDALATFGITVEVGERAGDDVATRSCLVDREVVDDEVRWDEPQWLDGGLWTELLSFALAPPRDVEASTLEAATLAYGLSRAGTVIEVAPGWRERFGTDRLDRRQVRAVDRRRARDLARPRATAPRRHGGREVNA